MDSDKIIQSLTRFATVLPALVDGISDADARWKPSDGGWSILEIIMHLADEETSDFRPRLERTMADPQEEWDPIDPEGWSKERKYNEANLKEAIARFITERRQSVTRLRNLPKTDWTQERTHPKLGTLRAGDLLASWAAHDALHLRQIARRLYQITQRDAGEFSTAYAGSW
jgi:uncharacterized damage-inducible protein DinB